MAGPEIRCRCPAPSAVARRDRVTAVARRNRAKSGSAESAFELDTVVCSSVDYSYIECAEVSNRIRIAQL